MKFIGSTQTIYKNLQSISGVISTNNVVPILENFLFDVEDGMLKVIASDLETTMTTQFPVTSNENGKIAVPAKILLETLKSLTEQPLTFSKDDESPNTLSLTYGNGDCKYNILNPDDFPKIPPASGTDQFVIPARVLHKAIQQCFFALSNDELRLAMTGMFVQIDPNGATFVATDAQKLVRYARKDITIANTASFILPKKALGLLKGSLPDDETPVTVSFNNSNAYFTFGSISLICRLIDGKYPDYNAVIPTDNPNLLTINRNDLLASLRRTSIFSNKSTYQVMLSMAGSNMKVSARDIDFSNEAKEELFCNYIGDDMSIGFNSKFLIDMLATMTSEDIKAEFSVPSRAGVMHPTDMDEHEDILMLIMPIMLNL
jgi:DNA polymerase III subunit beta